MNVALSKGVFVFLTNKFFSTFDELFTYEACAQHILGPEKSWPGRIKVYDKGKGWARDVWLTRSLWSPRDFILHGFQERWDFCCNRIMLS